MCVAPLIAAIGLYTLRMRKKKDISKEGGDCSDTYPLRRQSVVISFDKIIKRMY